MFRTTRCRAAPFDDVGTPQDAALRTEIEGRPIPEGVDAWNSPNTFNSRHVFLSRVVLPLATEMPTPAISSQTSRNCFWGSSIPRRSMGCELFRSPVVIFRLEKRRACDWRGDEAVGGQRHLSCIAAGSIRGIQ